MSVKACLRTSTVGVCQNSSSGVVVELVRQIEQASQRSCRFTAETVSLVTVQGVMQTSKATRESNLWCSRPARGSSQRSGAPSAVPQRPPQTCNTNALILFPFFRSDQMTTGFGGPLYLAAWRL